LFRSRDISDALGLVAVFAIALMGTQASAVINQAVENAYDTAWPQIRLKALVDNNEATKADIEKYVVATRKAK
jgi:hypothetical protein